jgi:transposase
MHGQDDARTLASAAQAHLRRLAVKAVRTGCTQTEAAKTYGVSLRAVNTWVAIDKVRWVARLETEASGASAWPGRSGVRYAGAAHLSADRGQAA